MNSTSKKKSTKTTSKIQENTTEKKLGYQTAVQKQGNFSTISESEFINSVIENKKAGNSWLKLGIISMSIILFFVIGYLISFLSAGNSNNNNKPTTLNLFAEAEIAANSITVWEISAQNNEEVGLVNAKIELKFDPNNFEILEISEDNVEGVGDKLVWNMENLDKGKKKSLRINAKSIGKEGSESEIKATFLYKIENSSLEFSSYKKSTVKILKPNISLLVSTVKDSYGDGEKARFKISIENKDIKTVQDLSLKINIPENFEIDFSETSSGFSTKTTTESEESKISPREILWEIAELKAGNILSFDLVGFVFGKNQEEKIFSATIQDFSDNTKIYSAANHSILIEKSIINVAMKINEKSDILNINPGEKLNFNIIVTNNGNRDTQSLSILIDLPKYINLSSIIAPQAEALDDQTLSFVSRGVPALSSLKPGKSAEINFEAWITSNIPIGSEVESDISFEITSFVREGFSNSDAGKIKSNSVKVNLNSNVELISTKAYYFPVSGWNFPQNTGPLPPSVNNETTFTILLEMENGSSNVENINLTAQLPSDVVFKNLSDVSAGEINYDSITRKITWSVESLEAFDGSKFSEKKIYAWIQVGIHPTFSDIGYTMPILNQPNLSFVDSFTNEEISKNYEGLDSSLPFDISAKIVNQGGAVKEFSEVPDPIILENYPDDETEVNDEIEINDEKNIRESAQNTKNQSS